MLPKPEDQSSDARDHVRVGCVESCSPIAVRWRQGKKRRPVFSARPCLKKKQGGAQLKKIPLASRDICDGS